MPSRHESKRLSRAFRDRPRPDRCDARAREGDLEGEVARRGSERGRRPVPVERRVLAHRHLPRGRQPLGPAGALASLQPAEGGTPDRGGQCARHQSAATKIAPQRGRLLFAHHELDDGRRVDVADAFSVHRCAGARAAPKAAPCRERGRRAREDRPSNRSLHPGHPPREAGRAATSAEWGSGGRSGVRDRSPRITAVPTKL